MEIKKKKFQSLLSEQPEKQDVNATKEKCIENLRALQLQNPEKFITRNFYRNEGGYSDSTWDKFFGTFKEFRRQAGLELTRQQHQLEVHTAKHASVDHYVEFYDTEVRPYVNKYEKETTPGHIKSMLICSDLHDIEVNEFCLSVFIDSCRRMQPDHIVFNGDIYDLYEFSKYSIDPRHCNIVERFEFVRERIFGAVRAVCPDAQIDFIMGNHEFRLIRHLADRSPFMRIVMGDVLDLSMADIFGLDKYQINWYSKVDFKAFTPKDISNQLKKNYKMYYDCYVVSHQFDNGFKMAGTNGHHHQVEVKSDYSILKGPFQWVQTPGMHELDAEYLDNTCKWNLGFLRVYINTESKTVIQQPISVHTDWAIVDGLFYKKK